MAIDFTCPKCQRMLRVPDAAAGKQAQCPQCNAVVDVPAGSSPLASGFSPIQPQPPATSPKQPPAEFPFSNQPYQPPPQAFQAPPQAFQPQSFSSPAPPQSAAGGSNPFSAPSYQTQPSYKPPDTGNPFSSPASVDSFRGGGEFSSEDLDAAKSKVLAPSIAMIVFAVLSWLICAYSAVNTWITRDAAKLNKPEEAIGYLIGVLLVMAVSTGICGLQIYGAISMKNLSNYALSMTAAVITLLVNSLCCCGISLPFGIWAIVVLLMSDVKAAFAFAGQRR